MALFHFLWLSSISVCVCVCVCVCTHIHTTSSLPYSSVWGHLGCFHVFAIVNSAAMNIGVHVSFFFFHVSFLIISFLLIHAQEW